MEKRTSKAACVRGSFLRTRTRQLSGAAAPSVEVLENRRLLSTVLQVGSGRTIPVDSFSWGINGGSGAKPTAGAITVALQPSDLSPGLLYAIANRTRYPDIYLIDQDSQNNETSRLDLQLATFTQYSTGGTANASAPQETVGIQFDKVTWTQAVASGPAHHGTWDIAGNTVDGGIFTGDPQFAGASRYTLNAGSGHMDLTGFSWGETSGGGPAFPLSFQFTAALNPAAVDLALSVANGRAYPSLTFTARNSKQQVYDAWTLSNAKITSYSIADQGGGGTQSFGVSFDTITHSFSPTATDGSLQSPITTGWNFATQTAVTGPLSPSGDYVGGPQDTIQFDSNNAIPISAINFQDQAAPMTTPSASASVTLLENRASPAFLTAVASGQPFNDAVLVHRDSAGRQLFSLDLKNVSVQTYQIVGSSAGGPSTEALDLSFSAISWSYYVINSAGFTIDTHQGSYNFAPPGGGAGGQFTGDPLFAGDSQYELDPGTGTKMNLTGFRWSEANPGGNVQFGSFNFTAALNPAAVDLGVSVPQRTHYNQLVFTARNSLGQVYDQWTLSNCTISDFSLSTAGSGEQVFDVTFAHVVHKYMLLNRDGSIQQTFGAEWDGPTQTGSTPSAPTGDGSATAKGLAVETAPEIPVTSITWGDSESNGAASAADFVVSLDESRASPALLAAIASGHIYNDAILVLRDSQGAIRSKLQLTNAALLQYQIGSGSQGPTEQVAVRPLPHIFWRTLSSTGTVVSAGDWDTTNRVSSSAVTGDPTFSGSSLLTLDTGQGKFDLMQYSWGESGGAAKPNLNDFTFATADTAASVDLALSVPAFYHYPQWVFTRRNSTGQTIDKWTLSNVSVSSFQDSFGSANAFTVHFDKVHLDHFILDGSGVAIGQTSAEWDQVMSIGFGPSLSGANVTFTGNGDGTSWTDPNNWSTGVVPGPLDDVTINLPGHALTLTGVQAVHSLINSDPLTITTGGSLAVQGSFQTSANLIVAGGTLLGDTVTATGGAEVIGLSGTLDGVTLNSNLDLSRGQLTVLDGLTLNGTANIGGTGFLSPGLLFSGTQTLSGPGTIAFAANTYDPLLAVANANTTLTLGPTIFIHGGGGGGGFTAGAYIGSNFGNTPNVTVINQGAIDADAPGSSITLVGQSVNDSAGHLQGGGGALIVSGLSGDAGVLTAILGGSLSADGNYFLSQTAVVTDTATFTLDGTWKNLGAVTVNTGNLNLGGQFITGNIGTINRTGGTVNITGALDNTRTTIALTATSGSWGLAGGTIKGGTVTGAGGANLIGISGTLDSVTLNTDLDLSRGQLTVLNGLVLNGTATIGGTNFLSPGLAFSGTQALDGSGTIAFAAATYDPLLAVATANTLLRIAPGIVIRGGGGGGGYTAGAYIGSNFGNTANVTVVNQGTIDADTPGTSITIQAATFTSQGIARGSNGGVLNIITSNSLTVSGGNTTISGVATISNLTVTGGNLTINGTSAVTVVGLNVSGGTIDGSAPLAITGNSTLSGGTLVGTGAASIPQGSSVDVTGSFTVGRELDVAGSINVAAGVLEIDGPGIHTGTFAISPAATLAFGGSATQTFAPGSSITGAGDVRFEGNSTSQLFGSFAVGALIVQDSASVVFRNSGSAGTVTVTGGTLTCGGPSTTAPAGFAAAVLPLDTMEVITKTIITGGDALVMPGWTLVADGSGLIFAGAGTVTLSNSDAVPGTLMLGGNLTYNASGPAAIGLTGTGTNDGLLDLGAASRTFLINNTSPAGLSVSAWIRDGSLVKTGAGTLTVSGGASFSGGTTIDDGVVQIQSASALGTGAIMFAGGALALGPGAVPANPLMVAAADSMNLDVGPNAAQLNLPSLGAALNLSGSGGGSLTVNNPVALQHDVDLSASVPLTIDGAISGGFGVFKTDAAMLTLGGSTANTYSGTTEVDGGTLVLGKTSGLAVPGALIVNAPGSAQLAAAGQIASSSAITLDSTLGPVTLDLGGFATTTGPLTVTGGKSASLGAAPAVLTCGGLNIAAGKLDLGKSKLMVAYGAGPDPAPTIRSYIAASSLMTSAAGLALGDADSADGVVSGLAAHTFLVRPTIPGDLNLDGKVSFSDLVALAANYNTLSGGIWDRGDFNRDGRINFADLVALAANYGRSAPAAAAPTLSRLASKPRLVGLLHPHR